MSRRSEPEDVAVGVAGAYADVMLVHDAPPPTHEVPQVALIRTEKEGG